MSISGDDDSSWTQTDVDVSRNSRLVRQGLLSCTDAHPRADTLGPSKGDEATVSLLVVVPLAAAAGAGFVGFMTALALACRSSKRPDTLPESEETCSQKTEDSHSYEEVKASSYGRLAVIPLPLGEDYITMSYTGTIV